MIDTTINVGTIIQLFAILAGGFYFIWEMRTRMAILVNSNESFSNRLSKIDVQLDSLVKVAIDIARQEERMNATDQRIQEISNRLETMKYVQTSNLQEARHAARKK